MESTRTPTSPQPTAETRSQRSSGWRAPDVIAVLRYRDPGAAIDWLERAFGFEPRAVHRVDGAVKHAELRLGSGMVMLGARDHDDDSGDARCQSVYVIVADVDAHCERARAAGAVIVTEPANQAYGSRDYQAVDPEDHLWSFGIYRPS